jgi:transcriptional regulator with XRE-family HTH domain
MKIEVRKAVDASKELTRENVVARRRKAPPPGAGVKDLMTVLEREHPALAAQAPVSSAAAEAGELVRSMRLAAKMPQRELAQAAGLRQPALSAIERGEGKDGPTYRKLRDLAEALGMRIAFMPKQEGPKQEGPKQEGTDATAPSSGQRSEMADVLGSLAKWLATEGGLPGGLPAGVDWTRVNVLFVGPHGVVRERSPAKRSLYRMSGDGRFIHGGRYTNRMSVNLSGGEEVDIVNTGEGIVVAVELPELGGAGDESGAGDET